MSVRPRAAGVASGTRTRWGTCTGRIFHQFPCPAQRKALSAATSPSPMLSTTAPIAFTATWPWPLTGEFTIADAHAREHLRTREPKHRNADYARTCLSARACAPALTFTLPITRPSPLMVTSSPPPPTKFLARSSAPLLCQRPDKQLRALQGQSLPARCVDAVRLPGRMQTRQRLSAPSHSHLSAPQAQPRPHQRLSEGPRRPPCHGGRRCVHPTHETPAQGRQRHRQRHPRQRHPPHAPSSAWVHGQ